ncbi:beta-phosphoglucomutase [Listeria fleischmannii 1991]|uniref:Beta-phosphoglucomutase n=2 Tax=Listeria fleischmannii TaxID=1069827 RepID=A0A2X3H830_9LIST|nr:beta-phosphoglucomutase [Listeria fleischmannii]EMG27188.1 beta-phosphoglucomutase [Listeria fleischmannii subsp. fleischmannii LU2006-1]KMT60014.1 beta-phosphoglucomutase [Listeria fleischmannii 1991]SQC68647.1 Putative beta-phosphoglucomutase [Listeria fleischmannii subsp. fleischmannii]
MKGIIFDLDGVITDTAKFHFEAWHALATSLGIPFDEAFNEKLKGVSRMDSLKLILENGNKLDQFNSEELQKLAAKKNEHYVRLLESLTERDILPGIQELLLAAKKQGVKCGVASVSKNAPTVLRALKLEKAFDFVADAAKIKRSKPAPEIFQVACAGLGLLPDEVIAIEDAEAGIKAINSANMVSIGIGATLTDADMTLRHTGLLDFKLVEILYSKARKGR